MHEFLQYSPYHYGGSGGEGPQLPGLDQNYSRAARRGLANVSIGFIAKSTGELPTTLKPASDLGEEELEDKLDDELRRQVDKFINSDNDITPKPHFRSSVKWMTCLGGQP